MKERKIYTYINLKDLRNASYYDDIKNCPQITVSSDLQKGLKGTRRKEAFDGKVSRNELHGLISDDNKNIYDFKTFFDKCVFNWLPEGHKWSSDSMKFGELRILSQFFRTKLSEYGQDNKLRNWLLACRKNVHSILSAIILLEECGIKPEEIDTANDRTLELFISAWKYLIVSESASKENGEISIQVFRDEMEKLKDKNSWTGILKKINNGETPKQIVIHGFYYFTPLQHRIFEMIENSGVELIILFPYDERYPFVNEIWDQTYSVENGYPAKSKWNMEKGDSLDPYGEIFEGNKAEIKNKLNIRKYDSIIEFADDIRRIKNGGYSIYSTNHHTANSILKDFYPEEYGERKLLSYPIGLFVDTLNRMWDEDRNTIILDEDSLIECFSSGWLMVNQISGKQYLQDLIYVMPFFGGCETVVEWEERIGQLEMIRKSILEEFYDELDDDEAICRWQKVMGNPLNQFSPFSVEPERLDVILTLIKQLLNMARELFGNNEPVKVKDHMNKLDQILRNYGHSGDLYDEELKLVDDIFETLDNPRNAAEKGYPSDIAAALNVYLTGRLDENEIHMKGVGLVMPMYQIDAATIKNDGKVHICLCDIDNMPGKKKQYVWPLNSSIIENIYRSRSGAEKYDVGIMKHVMEDSAVTNRYFIYSALRNNNVELSYISNMRGEPVTPSPYLVMMQEALQMDTKKAWKNHFITYGSVDTAEYAESRIRPYDKKRMPEVPKEARMDYALCPMKYVLSYVVEKHPTYSTVFHQNYAINGLISAIYSLCKDEGISPDEIFENIISLFPNMRSIEKRQVKDYISYTERYDDMDAGVLSKKGKKYYTDERLKVFFPNRAIREAANKLYSVLGSPDGRKGLNLYETTDVKDACIYCPHEEYCRNARFAVDSKNDQEAYYD